MEPADNAIDCDEVLLLKKKLAETEDKLVKFKKFVVNLRNERTQLQDQISTKDSEIEKYKSDLAKFQGKGYQHIFQNFQSLQAEYDKAQDEVELCKKTNKTLESDLLKCSQELSHCRDTCANQEEVISQLRRDALQQQSQINGLLDSNRELESRIIVLQTECQNEKKKTSDFQVCESERNEIKCELTQKNDEIAELSERLKQSLQRIGALEEEVAEKATRLAQYGDLQHTNEQQSATIQQLSATVQSQSEQIDQCNQVIDDLCCKNDQLEKKTADLQLNHSQKVSSLELTISELENKAKLSEADLNLSRTKFEEYKQRVSNVLKENKFNNCEYNKNIEELQFQVQQLQEENQTFRIKCSELEDKVNKIRSQNSDISSQLHSCQGDLKDYEELKAKFNVLGNEKSKLSTAIDQLKGSFAKEKQAILDEHSANIKAYENRIKQLEDEMINFRNTSDDSNSAVHSSTSFEEIKEENLSYQSTNSNSERNFLEEILNFDSSSRTFDVVPHSSNIDNLTQLLSESENSITLLSEQNRLLKEEIRRMQRSVDRMDIANNLEYLKNVLLKFLTIKGLDERERLITVLTTILKLTPEEREVFHQGAQDNYSPQTNISKWSLWQWSS